MPRGAEGAELLASRAGDGAAEGDAESDATPPVDGAEGSDRKSGFADSEAVGGGGAGAAASGGLPSKEPNGTTPDDAPPSHDPISARTQTAPLPEWSHGGRSPEESANFLSLLSAWWLTPLMLLGGARPLRQDDLYPLMDGYRAETIAGKTAAEKAEAKAAPSLLRALWDTYRLQFVWAGFLKLLSEGCNLASPVVLRYLLEVVSGGGAVPGRSKGFGYAMAGTLFAIQLLSTLATNAYMNRALRMGFQVRAALIQAIYGKTLRLSQAARAEFTAGKTVNLMSVDCSRLDTASYQLHTLWSAPMVVLVALGLLVAQLGPSALVGMALLLLLLPLQAYVMRFLMRLRVQANAMTDKRVRMTQETVAGIRVIKFLGWEGAMEEHLGEVRRQELVNVRRIGNWRAYITGITMTSPVLASVLTFVVYSLNNPLSPPVVFSSIALFNVLRMPLMMLPLVITSTTDAWVSMGRVQAMLLAPEVGDEDLPPVPTKTGTGAPGPASLPATRPSAPPPPVDPNAAIVLADASFDTVATSGRPGGTEMAARRAVRAADSAPPVPAPDAAPFNGLQDIQLTIAPGELVAIVGRVGAGKSSLLSAIVGEMKRAGGARAVKGTVALCPQTPWIQNATVRDNVRFGLPFDERKYARAVKAAALERDLQILPDGDLTEIGERGITLSGGQKARVSIARAVYADTDVVLLDDPLSAVDANVGRHLFEKCILEALAGKTRVLATHQIHVLPRCDRVVCIDGGRIVQQGTYAELMAERGGYLERLMVEFGGAKEGGEEESEGEETETRAESVGDGKIAIARKASTAPDLGSTIRDPKALMTAEERNAGSVKFRVYWQWIRFAGGVWFVSSVLLLLLAMQGTKVGTDTWLAQWSVNAFGFPLATYMSVYVVLGLLQGLCALLMGLLLSFQGRLASKRMHEAALGRVLHAPSSFFDQTPVGRIMNRFSKDVDAADNTLPETWRMFFTTFSTAFSTLILISIVQPIFIGVMVPMMVAYYFAQSFYRSTARELKRLDSISRSPLFANFGETLTGLSTIRAFRAEARFALRNEEHLDFNNRCYYLTLMIPRWLALRLESIAACLVFTAAMLAVGTSYPGAANAGLLSLAVTYSLQLTGTMNWMVRQMAETEVQMNGVERLLYYAEVLEQEAPPVTEVRPPEGWPGKGVIEFKGVEVRYRPDLPAVLRGVSFEVRAGERIGIVGRTGAGKSTIMQALFRLVEPSAGTVTIDGVDICQIGLADLRSKLAIIPQDATLFSGTARYNLDPFNEYTDDEVWDCLKRSGDVAATIAADPLKLEMQISENGENLSQGQRGLMCLARAMLRRSRIVVMDEATASVDLATDELIQQTIRTDERFRDRTVLTIAHRLQTVMDYDRILVMDHGLVVQFDTPAVLVDQEGPLKALVDETGPANAEVLRAMAKRNAGASFGAAVATGQVKEKGGEM
ncbi:P-loop containing nucleoside triphosphate hydrolase protein [Hyaloraphidium curvatum]|nr:P-loop containing nucleoside triphosphate hydrolase protein [Hyaloraphidium curvatum]